MQNILYYQTSEFDCGPTTLCNALRFLYEREQITPELLKHIFLYTLDAYNEAGESGKSGTSKMAMQFLSSWFNQYGKNKNFPIYSEFIENEQVYIGQNSRIVNCLQQKGVVVARVILGGDAHYVLLTGIKDSYISLFDPYEISENQVISIANSIIVTDQPKKMNRLVTPEVMNKESNESYSLGNYTVREAMLIYNTEKRKTPDNTIEYMI